MTKILPYLLPSIFICLIFVAWQEFDNAVREVKARELFSQGNINDQLDYEEKVLQAIGLLEYRNLLGHNVIVNAYLKGFYYQSLVFNLNDGEKRALYAQKAIPYFLVSTKQTPTFATGWANLAQMQWLLDSDSDEYKDYLQHAHRFGMHEFQAHTKLVILGVWIAESEQGFDVLEQSVFLHHLTSGLKDKKSRGYIISQVRNSTTAHSAFCLWLNNEPEAFKRLKCG